MPSTDQESIDLGSLVDRPSVLLAVLYERCRRGTRELFNARNARTSRQNAATEQHWVDLVGDRPTLGGASLQAELRALGSSAAPLLELGAALCAVDGWLADRPNRLSWHARPIPELGGDTWHVLPPARGQPSNLDRDGGDLGLDLDARLALRCRVIRVQPGDLRPSFRDTPASLGVKLGRGAGENLVVAIGSPAAGLGMTVTSRPSHRDGRGRVPYRFGGFKEAVDGSKAIHALGGVLDAAEAMGAQVLLLPELEVPPELLDWLKAELSRRRSRLGLVVAGSYHVEVGGRTVNRAEVLTGWGEPLWQHDKCVDFVIPAGEAAHLPAETLAMLGIDAGGGREDIALGEDLGIIDLPVGRLAVGICLDFCGDSLSPLLLAAGVNLVMVPAMTSSVGRFRTVAEDLGTRGRVCTWVANSGWLRGELGLGDDCPAAMLYLPRRRGWAQAGGPPEVVLQCSDGVVKPWPP